MKQLIISKTLIFIFVLLFVTGFESIFGQHNVLIGVTTVVALLMYLERDLTVSPWKSLLLILTVNVSQGIFGQIALINPWIGLPVNFIAMFMVGYLFTSNIKGPIQIAVGLQYLFILTNPVSPQEFPMRLVALVVGALIIMTVQWVINRRKLSKKGNQYFLQVCSHLQDKINHIRNLQSDEKLDSLIQSDIIGLRKVIYFRIIKGYYLTHEGRARLKLSVCLEKLHLLLKRTDAGEYPEDVLDCLNHELAQMKDYVNKRSNLSDHSLNKLREAFNQNESAYMEELISTLKVMREILVYLSTNEASELNKIEGVAEIPEGYRNAYLFLKDINRHSARFTYAIRLGITIALAAFIVDYFDIHEGRWMLFTIFSVTQPYYETAKYRFKERVIGTLMGVAIFVLLFSFFHETSIRSFLVLLVGYLNGYAVKYRNVVLTVTISALGTAALTGDPAILSMRRVILVLIGIAIGMLANRFILPHTLEKGTRDLIERYKRISRELLSEVSAFSLERNHVHAHTINHLFAVSTLIEERMSGNNQLLQLKGLDEFLSAQRRLNHSIYEMFLRMQRDKVDFHLIREILMELDIILGLEGDKMTEQASRLYDRLQLSKSLEEYVMLKDALRIFKGFRKQAAFK